MSKLKAEFLAEGNVIRVANTLQLRVSAVFPVMKGYARDDVLVKAQGCLAVLNMMFVQSITNQEYDILGQNLCKKMDREDIDY